MRGSSRGFVFLTAAVVLLGGVLLYRAATAPSETERFEAAIRDFHAAHGRMTPPEVRQSFGPPDEVFRNNPRALCWAYRAPYRVRMCWGPKRRGAWIGHNVPLEHVGLTIER